MCNKIYIKKLEQELDIDKLCARINPGENDILFISGSLIEGQTSYHSEGMGNKKSDIDIFVFSDRIEHYSNIDYNEKYCKTTFLQLQGIQFDIEIYRINDLMCFWKNLDEIHFADGVTDNIRTMNLLKTEEAAKKKYMSATHRLLNGICVYNYKRYEEIKKQVNLENYYTYNVRMYINIIDLCYDDVLGYLDEGQGMLAVLMARKLLLYAAGAYLFANKISFDREKWVPLLMENLSRESSEKREVFEEFKKLLFYDNLLKDKDYIKNAKDILLWINKLVDCL